MHINGQAVFPHVKASFWQGRSQKFLVGETDLAMVILDHKTMHILYI